MRGLAPLFLCPVVSGPFVRPLCSLKAPNKHMEQPTSALFLLRENFPKRPPD